MVIADIYRPSPVTLVTPVFEFTGITLLRPELEDITLLCLFFAMEDRTPSIGGSTSGRAGESIGCGIVVKIIDGEESGVDVIGFGAEADVTLDSCQWQMKMSHFWQSKCPTYGLITLLEIPVF